MTESNNVNKRLIQDLLTQVNFWLVCYEKSGGKDDLDTAIRFADGIRPYLPSGMREMDLFELANVGFYMTPKLPGEPKDE